MQEKLFHDSAISYTRSFFKSKRACGGGIVEMKEILSSENISFIMSTDIVKACDIFYEKMKTRKRPRNIRNIGPVKWDIQIFLYALKQVKSRGIPKCFQGGIVLLFLKYCKGIL